MSVKILNTESRWNGVKALELEMKTDCTKPLRIGNIRALNGCAGRLFGAATLHNHKNSANITLFLIDIYTSIHE